MADADVVVGVGDDAAVVNGRPGFQWVVSCDTMVEEIHFKPVTMRYGDIGFKAMASNISDMAAMGAQPRFALVALSAPKSLGSDKLKELYDGLYDCAGRYGVAVIGGDTTSSPAGLTVTVTILGEVESGRALLRSAAQPGDAVFVVGALGESAAGLHALLKRGRSAYHELEGAGPPVERLIRAHQRPLPQVEAGRLLARSGMGRALNDISDGLASEAWEIAEASGATLLLEEEAIPVGEELASYGAEEGFDPLDWVFFGGEDYGLVGTTAAENVEALGCLMAESGILFHRIGSVEKVDGHSGVWLRRRTGERQALEKKGYNHFGSE